MIPVEEKETTQGLARYYIRMDFREGKREMYYKYWQTVSQM